MYFSFQYGQWRDCEPHQAHQPDAWCGHVYTFCEIKILTDTTAAMGLDCIINDFKPAYGRQL